MDAFLATLQARGLFPVFGHVAVFVCGKATTIDQIRRLCARFPLEEIIARHTGLDWFGTMTTGVAEWDHSKPDRLEVMQMILEAGVDPNIKKARADQVLARCWWTGDKTASDGPLHQAAERGDVEMVELLLRYGAKNTLADLHGLSPSERARMAGHNSVASMIEAWVPHEEAPEVWASSYVVDGDVTFE
ncbi:hypothetical protein CHU98_g11229 [Xylaria longipes]|nr:hypothetical protein CHU98_g11229 [Xylaria longipes]